MSSTAKAGKIDELMDKASAALAGTSYFEAERMALKALAMARQIDDFDRMARIVLPLLEARRQRIQLALDVGKVTIVKASITEETKIETGCFLIQPPQVGADARRLRLAGLHQEVPVAVVCREPLTQLRFWPIVSIGACGSVRVKIDPPDDPENPDMAWFVGAMEALGDAAIESLDPALEITRRVDQLIDRLDCIPDHEKLHQALAEACHDAHRATVNA